MAVILIVDDETNNLKLLAAEFKHQHHVIVAKNGDKALKIAFEKQPDVILLDVIMPGMDGFATMKQLQNNALTSNIPVIFITGLDSEENQSYGLQLGAADYIFKPFYLPVVQARVNTQLQLVKLKRQLNEARAMLQRNENSFFSRGEVH